MSIPNQRFLDGLHPAQLDAWRAFDEGKKRFFLLKWHRRARKTTFILNVLIRECVFNPKSVYVYIAPTYKQAKSIVWRDPNMLFRYLPEQDEMGWEKNESELFIKFANDSLLLIKGGDDPDSLRGIDASGIAPDEWAQMKPEIWLEIFRPIITQGPNRWAMFAYTPKGENHATELWREAENWGDWYTSELKASESRLLASSELEKAKREMPTFLYDQEFECAELTDEEFTLITSRLLDSLQKIEQFRPQVRRLVTCDPALIHGDLCIAYAMENTAVLGERVFRQNDTKKIAWGLKQFGLEHEMNVFAIDNIGIGKGIVDELAADGQIVIPFDSREKASDERFANKRAEAWWYVMRQMMDGEVDYPQDMTLRQELSSVRIKPIGYHGRIILEPKYETKKRLGRSPDRGDAFVQGVYCSPMVSPEIEHKDDYDRHKDSRYDKRPESAMVCG